MIPPNSALLGEPNSQGVNLLLHGRASTANVSLLHPAETSAALQ